MSPCPGNVRVALEMLKPQGTIEAAWGAKGVCVSGGEVGENVMGQGQTALLACGEPPWLPRPVPRISTDPKIWFGW